MTGLVKPRNLAWDQVQEVDGSWTGTITEHGCDDTAEIVWRRGGFRTLANLNSAQAKEHERLTKAPVRTWRFGAELPLRVVVDPALPSGVMVFKDAKGRVLGRVEGACPSDTVQVGTGEG